MGIFDRNPTTGSVATPLSSSGSGEVNTASNLGAGYGVFSSKVGVDLQFKSLIEGDGISLTQTGTDITIASAASAVSAATPALDNLSSVNINTSLLSTHGINIGDSTNPFSDIYVNQLHVSQLVTPAGQSSIDAGNRWTVYPGGTIKSLDYGVGVGNDILGVASADYKNRKLFDGTPLKSYDYGTRQFFDSSGVIVYDHQLRQLNDSGGVQILNHVGPSLDLRYDDNTGLARIFKMFDNTDVNWAAIGAPAAVTSYTLILPSAQGALSQTLVNDGSGNLSWDTPAKNAVFGKENFTLSSGDISNGFVDLSQVVTANSVIFSFNGLISTEGTDYTVDLTGGAGGKTRITFSSHTPTLVATNKINIMYSYV